MGTYSTHRPCTNLLKYVQINVKLITVGNSLGEHGIFLNVWVKSESHCQLLFLVPRLNPRLNCGEKFPDIERVSSADFPECNSVFSYQI
jgi:hypothetical protein